MSGEEIHQGRRDNARSCSSEADAGAVEQQEQGRVCNEGQRGGQRSRNHRHTHCKMGKKKILVYPVSIHQGALPGSAWAAPTNDVCTSPLSPYRLRLPSQLIRMPESMLPTQPEAVSDRAYRNTWSSMLGSQVCAALQIMRMQIFHSSAYLKAEKE